MSGSGNMIPQSRTRILPSTSTQAQLRPISPRPPRKTIRTGRAPPCAEPARRSGRDVGLPTPGCSTAWLADCLAWPTAWPGPTACLGPTAWLPDRSTAQTVWPGSWLTSPPSWTSRLLPGGSASARARAASPRQPSWPLPGRGARRESSSGPPRRARAGRPPSAGDTARRPIPGPGRRPWPAAGWGTRSVDSNS